MDLIEFREYCLALGDVSEKMPFGKFARRYDSLLVFYVMGHMFCIIDIDDFSYVSVRSTPDEIGQIRMSYTASDKPLNRSLRHWLQLNLGGDIPDAEILRLVERAFHIIQQQYSRKR